MAVVACGHERAGTPATLTGAEAVEWRIDTIPTLDLGSISGGEEYEFYQIRGAVRLSTGQIVVADASSRQLRFFGSHGSYQFSAGGRGEGPGEFRWIDSLVVRAGDTLVVMEHARRILSEFDSGGAFQRSRHLDAERFIWFSGVLSNGDAIVMTEATIDVDPGERILEQDSFSVLEFSRSENTTRVIGRFPKAITYTRTFGNCNIGVDDPLGRQVRIAVAGDRIAVGHTQSSRIRIAGPAGSEHYAIHLGLKSRGTAAAALAELRNRYQARADDQPASTCEYSRRALEILDEIPPPESLPLFGRLIFDDLGNLWVEEFSVDREEFATWHVFDSNGDQIATARVPGHIRITQIGLDFVLGITSDDMGVEGVQLYGLRRD